MLKYHNTLIGLQEIPDEVSLVINISNCPIRCRGCHAKMLWGDIGEPLTPQALTDMLGGRFKEVSCVCFMGGDIAPDEVDELAEYIRQNYPHLKIGWYSGRTEICLFTQLKNFDYIKLGPFKKKFGGLDSSTTNQRLYRIENGKLQDVTQIFWK